MKTINLTTILVVIFTISVSISNYAQQNHNHSKIKTIYAKRSMMEGDIMQQKSPNIQFNDSNLNKAYMHYIMINTALTKSNIQKVKMISERLIIILNNYGKASESIAIASKLAESSDLKGQRKLFAELTISIAPFFKESITKGKVYKNFCPMANGNGAYWLSNSKNIVNPYMGEKSPMSSCGSIKDTYKSI
jgi:hypothetical protein